MSGRREEDQSVTLGEVYRLVRDLKEEHGSKLDGIDKQVRITNGRTTALEVHVARLNEDVDALTPPPPPGVPVITPDGESLSIKVSPKMWAAIVAIGSVIAVFVPMVTEWVKTLMGSR